MSAFRLQQQNKEDKDVNTTNCVSSVEDVMRYRDHQNSSPNGRLMQSNTQSQGSTANWASSVGSVEDAMKYRNHQNSSPNGRLIQSITQSQGRAQIYNKNVGFKSGYLLSYKE